MLDCLVPVRLFARCDGQVRDGCPTGASRVWEIGQSKLKNPMMASIMAINMINIFEFSMSYTRITRVIWGKLGVRAPLKIMTRHTPLAAAWLCMAGVGSSCYADVLLMQMLRELPPNSSAGLERPKSGVTMSEVIARFGKPNERFAAVGSPPISRWTYDNYTVYFEHNHVIHTVIKRTAHNAQKPL